MLSTVNRRLVTVCNDKKYLAGAEKMTTKQSKPNPISCIDTVGFIVREGSPELGRKSVASKICETGAFSSRSE